ncbi:MAG: GFA family protein [Kofleriaceae bacterium]
MQTYRGSCHCGAISYDVTMDPPEKAFACNCSICSRSGTLLAFVPADQFSLVADGKRVDYQFGKKQMHHEFCATCGVRSFVHGADGKGKEMTAINLRCLHDFDEYALPVEMWDGAKT